MKRHQNYAGVSIAIAVGGACIVGGIVAFAISQNQPPPEPQPSRQAAVAPAPAAKPSLPAKTKKEEADRITAELQAKLAAMPEPKEPAADSIPGNAVPRSQFRENVVGKTFQEVMALYGRPDSSIEASSTSWTYRRRTYDPNTGRPDTAATLYFRGAIVERVSFY